MNYADQKQPSYATEAIRVSSEIDEQRARLMAALGNLTETRLRLRDRLNTVCKPMPPKPPSAITKLGEVQPMSDVGSSIKSASEQVEQANYELVELMASLAV